MTEQQVFDSITVDQPLRIAALAKQIPVAESLVLGPNGRLVRDASPLEMNAYCRRAVSKGVETAAASGGSCVVFTLGPPSAEDVLREAVAWGADDGLQLCDRPSPAPTPWPPPGPSPPRSGCEGPFDLILVGRNTIDGDTGQVGPEVAEVARAPLRRGVRRLGLDRSIGAGSAGGRRRVARGGAPTLPAVLSVPSDSVSRPRCRSEGRRAVAPRPYAASVGGGSRARSVGGRGEPHARWARCGRSPTTVAQVL